MVPNDSPAPTRNLIVSNRLPVTIQVHDGVPRSAPSAGGLATSMRQVHAEPGSCWIGWPGDTCGLAPEARVDLDEQFGAQNLRAVHLERAQVERFYEGFSNGVLWPLFHYSLERVRLDAWKDWEAYREVNERFAETVAQVWQPGDRIWVHDYQLALVPQLLRARLPEASIGFFLHIPFPASAAFRILPWRREILEGMLGADLIGFQTYSFQRHFMSALLRVLGLEPRLEELEYRGRVVRVGSFPISIDTRHFVARSAEPETSAAAEALRANHPGCQLLVGVDRLDYTKGLPRRVLAVERLLERAPHLHGKFKFIQVAVPSRTGVEAYEKLRREIDELIGRVNGRFSNLQWSPVQYLYRSVDEAELLALYRAGDVMLVTPLRDGMNLVAKEYVACQLEHDGVLVLSEFAGAAWELGDALLVNPYDVDQTAQAIQEALEMTPEARAERMKSLRRRVQQWTVHHWTSDFLGALDAAHAENSRRQATTALPAGEIERLLSGPGVALVLDYDGTLVPFASTPDRARPDSALVQLLQRLAQRRDRVVHLASGRDRATLLNWFGALGLGLHAEHGYWSRTPDGEWVRRPVPALDWMPSVRAIMERFCEHAPGSFVEEKAVALAWHYRRCEPQFGASQARELRSHLAKLLANQPAEVLPGVKVVEVRPAGIHKGLIVQDLAPRVPAGWPIVAIGDDATDEDLFRALPADGVSIHVGSRDSVARYRLSDPTSVRLLLERFASAGLPA